MDSPNPSEKEQPAINPHGESGKHAKKAKPVVPPEPSSEARPQPCENHKQISCNINRDWIDKATLGFEGLGLFVLIVYAIFTIKIWSANERAATAAKNAVDIAAKNFRVDERAWITITIGDFIVPLGTQMVPTVYISNTGKTPALNVNIDLSAVILGKDDIPEFTYGIDHPSTRHETPFLFPNTPAIAVAVAATAPHVTEMKISKYTKKLRSAMNARKSYMVLYWKITYDDAFGIQHWNTACSHYPTDSGVLKSEADIPAMIIACKHYDGIDDNQ